MILVVIAEGCKKKKKKKLDSSQKAKALGLSTLRLSTSNYFFINK